MSWCRMKETFVECHLFDAKAKCQGMKSKETHKTIIRLVLPPPPPPHHNHHQRIENYMARSYNGRLLISSHPSSRCLLGCPSSSSWRLDSPVRLDGFPLGNGWQCHHSWRQAANIHKNFSRIITIISLSPSSHYIVVMKRSRRRMTKQKPNMFEDIL